MGKEVIMWWELIVGAIGLGATICVIPLVFYSFRKMLRELRDYYG